MISGVWTSLWSGRLNDRLRTGKEKTKKKLDAVSSRNGFSTADDSAIIDSTPLASELYGIFNSLRCFES